MAKSRHPGSTVSDYLIARLEQAGVKHIFGVPGDYVLDFMDHLVSSPIRLIGTCNELNAGYAADAYARMNGIGAAVVTYDVGGLSLVNAVAGAYAERVPLAIISGAPHSDRRQQTLMHHLATDYGLQVAVFEKITVAAEVLADAERAPEQIDRVLNACLRHKRPVYFEIPVDLVGRPCRKPEQGWRLPPPSSHPENLAESVSEAAAMLSAAKHPAILVGVEVHRFGLRKATVALLDKAGYPAATTVQGKTAIPEEHPDFIGVYQAGLSREEVRDTIEGADCLLMLGAWLTDVTTGGFTAHLDPDRMISANSDRVKIRRHYFEEVYLTDFIPSLAAALKPKPRQKKHWRPRPHAALAPFVTRTGRPLSTVRFWERMKHFIDETMIVLADTGDSMIGSAELETSKAESYIAQAYYLSIGYTLPGTLGVALARPDKRPVLFIGDGAFQMTAQELSTIIRYQTAPVIFLMNNDGYAVERAIHDGPYNELQPWRYHRLPGVFGDAVSAEAHTEGDLEQALASAKRHRDKLVFIEVHIPRTDYTEGVRRLGKLLRKLSVK